MESRKILLKVFKIIFPFADFAYLLQHEEYSLQRVWFWLPRFFFRRNFQKRGKLVYTQRVKSVLTLSVFSYVLINYLLVKKGLLNMAKFVALLILIPAIVVISNSILGPVYFLIRQRIIAKSKRYFDENKGQTKVIAITGSFGKTTLKNFLEQLLKYNYRVQMVPGNINSTIGIANWILSDFEPGVEILITELDSYKLGRIKQSTNFLNPDISIITNIGDQHLQRYKTKKNLAKSLYELFEFSNKDSYKLTTEDTYKYLKDEGFNVKVVRFPKSLVLNKDLSGSNLINFTLAGEVAVHLNVPEEYINHLQGKLKLPDRRQSSQKMHGFEAIDDSYNISLISATAGVIEANRQARMKDKRLLVVTAGIPELGPEDKAGNRNLGRLLDEKSDQIFILSSIFRDEIYSGIKDKTKVKVYKTYNEAIQNLKNNYETKDWFVLIQPELTDLYY
jgi:UDP-N-acetylmuramoyl-tripeptide--D-alanyl-D-alanine ligase